MNTQSSPLNQLLNQGAIWPARQQSDRQPSRPDFIATGHQPLDEQLIGNGLQPGNLLEVLYEGEGSGELRLLLPMLARLSQQPRWIIWVDPPHIPYAPALAAAGVNIDRILMVHSKNQSDRLWTLEQALKSGSCSAVLGWLPAGQNKAVRRLQLAVTESAACGFLFRPLNSRNQSSSAPYRISLQPRSRGVDVTLLKRKNGWAMPTRQLSLGEEQILPPRPAATAAALKLVSPDGH